MAIFGVQFLHDRHTRGSSSTVVALKCLGFLGFITQMIDRAQIKTPQFAFYGKTKLPGKTLKLTALIVDAVSYPTFTWPNNILVGS